MDITGLLTVPVTVMAMLMALTDLFKDTTGSLTAPTAFKEDHPTAVTAVQEVMAAREDRPATTMEAVTAVRVVLEALLATTMAAVTAPRAVQAALEGPATAPGLKETLTEMATPGESTTIDSLMTRSPSPRSTPTPAATAEIDGG